MNINGIPEEFIEVFEARRMRPAQSDTESAQSLKPIVVGLYLGVWLATLLASLCAWLALVQPSTRPWQRGYWWGVVWWAAIWVGGCGVVCLVRRFPCFGRGALALLARLFFAVFGAVLSSLFIGHYAGLVFVLLLFTGDLELFRCSCEESPNDRMVRWIKDAPSRIIPATVLLTDEQKSVLRAFTGIGTALTLLVMGWGYFQWGSEAARIAALPSSITSPRVGARSV